MDQQWESQLINDAEFTANAQLPSVTFDVNNSYVSQQLGQRIGEEVSHFYHPTPPPPRNVNGFWRGVDDVLEMQEGTMEAFSSVYTNNYQMPNDRWEAIGYAASVPLAMGTEFIATEAVLGLEAVENVYQGSQQVFAGVSQKLERWGLFGKQIASDMPTFGSRSLLEKHFEKHGGEFKSAFKSPDEYLIGAHNVIKNGIKVAYEYKGEIRLGYAKFMGTTEGKSIIEGINNPGVAKFEFVGTNLQGDITTYFTPSGKNFWNIINNNSLDKTIVPYEMMKLEETAQFISQFMKP